MTDELLKRVGAAILEAESRWTPKSAESKERAMARAALEALPLPLLQSLHDHEIAGKIEWLFDSAWRVEIGSPVHASATVKSEAEALAWLKARAIEIYGVKPEELE